MKKKNQIDRNSLKKKDLNTLVRIFFSSFLTISFFYVLPILLNFFDKNFNNKEFAKKKKKILAYTLNSSEKKIYYLIFLV